MSALEQISDWPVPAAAAAVVGAPGVLATHGDIGRAFALASVTKPLVARAVQVAIEEGAVDLDTAAGPPGSTVRHLLAHASGLAMLEDRVMAKPGTRRIYSNVGFAVLAQAVEHAAGIEFGRYLAESVFEPLGMAHSALDGGARTAGYGASSTVSDLAAFAGDLLSPAIVSPQMHSEAIAVAFPGWRACCPATASSVPTTGASVSRSEATNRRTGPGPGTRRTRSAISASRARSSGRIRSLAWPWWC